jgi:hypothetical protein
MFFKKTKTKDLFYVKLQKISLLSKFRLFRYEKFLRKFKTGL